MSESERKLIVSLPTEIKEKIRFIAFFNKSTMKDFIVNACTEALKKEENLKILSNFKG